MATIFNFMQSWWLRGLGGLYYFLRKLFRFLSKFGFKYTEYNNYNDKTQQLTLPKMIFSTSFVTRQ